MSGLLLVLMVLYLHSNTILADDLEILLLSTPEPSHSLSLEETIKQIMQDPSITILAAHSELIEGKKIHIIKILTADGHLYYLKIDAATGKLLDKSKK